MLNDGKDLMVCTNYEIEKQNIPAEKIYKAVAHTLAKLIEQMSDGYLFDPVVDVRPASGEICATVEICFNCNHIDKTLFEILSVFSAQYGSSQDFDIELWSKDTEEDYREQNDWLKEQDKEAWEEVQKYKYDGNFEVTLSYYIKPEKWKELVG